MSAPAKTAQRAEQFITVEIDGQLVQASVESFKPVKVNHMFTKAEAKAAGLTVQQANAKFVGYATKELERKTAEGITNPFAISFVLCLALVLHLVMPAGDYFGFGLFVVYGALIIFNSFGSEPEDE